MKHVIVKLLVALAAVIPATAGYASVASAANCTPYVGGTYWYNALDFDAGVTNCTGVDAANFTQSGTGWWDITLGQEIASTGAADTLGGGFGSQLITQPFGTRTPWCLGTAHTVQEHFRWRIHNASTGTWGSFHVTYGTAHVIWC